MVVEWLQFRLAPEQREAFIRIDAEIWTPFLAEQVGFISKEVWLDNDRPDELAIAIRWESFEQWFDIPPSEIDRVQVRFDGAFPYPYELLAVRAYQARKFPHR
ncbi:antibiotic biosynthesis monooxygenase [Rubidibacter lacunae KORDI 51-2]|uniref:Antibiotic biosynthesis monooxygenase n=1 Tax=Rubidibacter lacunae KORDI 51-2 TaxID=582515 RepID=U5D737_9CHRO|nr:TIGR03792 family protein [Rubidibacter lacunae]ERN40463.1 antibiotic biosynthesis monooxygenase [Rubidibacter lacunae KORDI 51-2]